MTKDEFLSLPKPRTVKPMISAVSGPDRTLLYGYTCDRETFHVYQVKGVLNVVIYTFEGHVLAHRDGEMPCEEVIPNKRLYPEACDLEFCRALLTKGMALPFTLFDAESAKRRGPGPFFGKRYTELLVAALGASADQ